MHLIEPMTHRHSAAAQVTSCFPLSTRASRRWQPTAHQGYVGTGVARQRTNTHSFDELNRCGLPNKTARQIALAGRPSPAHYGAHTVF